jgi:hypothetical protein
VRLQICYREGGGGEGGGRQRGGARRRAGSYGSRQGEDLLGARFSLSAVAGLQLLSSSRAILSVKDFVFPFSAKSHDFR